MKYDFSTSRYARFFSENEDKFLQSYLDNSDLFHTNYGWYKTQGTKDPNETPVADDGTATFQAKSRKVVASPMMDLRAPLGDSNQMDQEGVHIYTGTIPDFIAPGFVENSMERNYKVKMFEQFGNDADIVAAYTRTVQSMIDSSDATLTWMTAQLMTTGKIDYSKIGRGIRTPLQNAMIPAENFVNAGDKAWADASCNVLTQMRKIEENYRYANNLDNAPLVWQMTRNTFHDVFLHNSEVMDFVKSYRTLNYIASTKAAPNDTEWQQAVKDLEGVSPIQIVEEKERNKTHTSDSFIQGWADNIVVLRPAGDAVQFKHKAILDQSMDSQYGNNQVVNVYGVVNNGLGLLRNTEQPDGRFKKWGTDLMMSACPVLIDVPYHWIIDITKAG